MGKKNICNWLDAQDKFSKSYTTIQDKTNIYNYFFCNKYFVPFDICCIHSSDLEEIDGYFGIRLIRKWCIIDHPNYDPTDIYIGMPQFNDNKEYQELGKYIKILDTICSCDYKKCNCDN